jgi:hypothetical protein
MNIQAVMSPGFLILGLSHLLQPQLWVRFFELIRQTRMASVIIPMYTLPIGLILIVEHNRWEWDWSLFLTIAGWVTTIKSTFYLLSPGIADRMLEKQMVTSPRSYQVVGLIMTVFGGVLTWRAWT